MAKRKSFGFTQRKGKIQKVNFATFDIESSNWTDFRILGFFDGVKYYEFYLIEEFLEFVIRRDYRHYKIYAHNGGRFDFKFLLQELVGKDTVKIIDVNGSLIQLIVQISGTRHTVVFRDSFALLPQSLKKLTETFDVKHKKLDLDGDYNFDTITPEKKLYLKYDCLGLYEVLTAFQKKINSIGGNIKLTTASTSLDLFQRKYFPPDLPYIPNYRKLEPKIRQGYYGGRTEVFRRYGENLYYYDFNSLYPAVMESNLFPVGNPIHVNNYKFNSNDIGFSYIKTFIPEMFVPPLPYRKELLLQFPTGKIDGWYPHPFLKLLKRLEIGFEIKETILFQGKSIFSSFVIDLYEIRLANKKNALDYVTKIMLNSYYGKFAQRILRKEFVQNPKSIVGLTNYDIDLNLFYKEKVVEATYILPAISAYVTAYAQMKMYDVLYSLQDEIFYCDTDSIVTSCEIETSEELGKLKIEHEIRRGIFLSQKIYAFIDDKNKFHYKAKGYNKQFCTPFVWQDFEKALYENDFSAFNQEFKALWGFKESLTRVGKVMNFDYKKKSIRNVETKRKFVKNFSTEPLKNC